MHFSDILRGKCSICCALLVPWWRSWFRVDWWRHTRETLATSAADAAIDRLRGDRWQNHDLLIEFSSNCEEVERCRERKKVFTPAEFYRSLYRTNTSLSAFACDWYDLIVRARACACVCVHACAFVCVCARALVCVYSGKPIEIYLQRKLFAMNDLARFPEFHKAIGLFAKAH